MTAPHVLLVVKGLDLGGIERVVIDLAVGLHRDGVPVEVAVVNERRDALLGVLTAAAVPVHLLHGSDRIGLRASVRLAGLLRRGRFDVVHAHGPAVAVVARVAALGTRVRVVSTVHNSWRRLRPLTRIGWRLTRSLDDVTIAVSASAAASVPGGTATGPIVVPHGLDRAALDAARALAPALRTALLDGHAVLAVTVASHREQKNYPNLLRAVRLAVDHGVDLRLVAVGAGPRLARNQRVATQLGLAGVVVFEPPRPDAMAVIAAADLLVVASDYEGQPLVVQEALALGRPVVATAVGRVPELVGPGQGRVVPPEDPRALGAALAEVASHPGPVIEPGPLRTVDDVVADHLALYGSGGGST